MEDWAEIRRLRRAEVLSVSEIARVLGISRNTVRAALASDGPPRYVRRTRGSVVDAFEPRIRELLQAYPTMPSTVIAERIGWPYSIRTLSGRVAEWRPAYLPPDPASRTSYVAGEIAQCDFWFPPVTLPVGFWQARTAKRLPVLTMVCGYSRWASALLVPTRAGGRSLRRVVAVDRSIGGGAPGAGLESAIGRWRGRRSELTAECQAFGAPWQPRCSSVGPADPEAKGLVERFHDYLERSFLPGRVFASPADFNSQLASWLARANTRHHRSLGCAPAQRVEADRAAMIGLPPVPPVVGWRHTTRLGRDHYVRLDGNGYSVHPAVIGRRIEVVADLGRVRAVCDGKLVADHHRVWVKHQSITDVEHFAAARALRRDRLELIRTPTTEPEVQQRCLADYDAALGIDGGVA